ncbi:MAG: cyclic nucleotide-binding domain-containing protein [Parachlamydiales bacterium]|nr:cyclic nucleotide-binding domain-containing protein [Parachlamydiales bacterium]
MERVDIIAFLRQNELTKGLSLQELEELIPFIQFNNFNLNEMVFNEGDASRELFLVVKGKLAVLRKVEERFERFGIISEGQFFGEMAHLENEKRSASVQVLEPVTAISINLDKLQATENVKPLYFKIVTQLAKKVSGNLRRTDQTLIESLKDKLSFMQTHRHTSDMLIHVIVLVAIWFNLFDLTVWFPTYRQTIDMIVTGALFLAFSTSTFYVIWTSGYPLAFFGLTFKNWFRVSVEAILYSLPIMLLFAVLKWVLIHNVDIFSGQTLFAKPEKLKELAGFIGVYIVLAPLQEFVARGGIQTSFRNFFQGPNRVIAAIVISNLIFQMLHTTKDPWIAIASLICGFFWGMLFETQKSLIGVIISHVIIGTWGFFILDFDTLIRLFDASRGI